MAEHLQRDLESLQAELLALSSMAEQAIERACRALRFNKPDLAREVIEGDGEIDRREIEIEEECLKILALHQPVAVDLRRTAAILKINNDLERIADLAVNIAERAVCLTDHPEFAIPDKLQRMVRLALNMVHDALDAFVALDVHAAQDVCVCDDEVDDCNREIIGELYQMIRQDSTLVEAALHVFSAARHIERIADHATNIAEDVIYLVEGEIARHRSENIYSP